MQRVGGDLSDWEGRITYKYHSPVSWHKSGDNEPWRLLPLSPLNQKQKEEIKRPFFIQVGAIKAKVKSIKLTGIEELHSSITILVFLH